MVITCLHFPNVLNPKQLFSVACQSGGLSKRPKLGFNLPASTSSAATNVTVTGPKAYVLCKELPAKTRKEGNRSEGISLWQASSTLTSGGNNYCHQKNDAPTITTSDGENKYLYSTYCCSTLGNFKPFLAGMKKIFVTLNLPNRSANSWTKPWWFFFPSKYTYTQT